MRVDLSAEKLCAKIETQTSCTSTDLGCVHTVLPSPQEQKQPLCKQQQQQQKQQGQAQAATVAAAAAALAAANPPSTLHTVNM
jgi:hypothetical protein